MDFHKIPKKYKKSLIGIRKKILNLEYLEQLIGILIMKIGGEKLKNKIHINTVR